MKITIQGHPASKKNSQQIIVNKRTGRPMLIQGKIYREYEKHALKQLLTFGNICYVEPVMVSVQYFVKDKRRRDLLNLLAATADILEKSGLVLDDTLIVSVDGSRIVGVDRENPRAEITITPDMEAP